MRILFLGYNTSQTKLVSALARHHTVDHSANKITPEQAAGYDLIISFGYRHILKKPVLGACKRPPINLHISYLPYNKGAHPNFWAWYEGTPHGVTIHHIDAGTDTGDILFQQELNFPPHTTLAQSYNQLIEAIESLFVAHKTALLEGQYTPIPQTLEGTIHKKADLPEFTGGWQQTIDEIKQQLPK